MPLYEKRETIPYHERHDKHLCSLVANGLHIDDYKNYVKNPSFVCKQCGRVAAKDENLCFPLPLE